VYNFGFSLGLNFRLPKGYSFAANTSFAKLTRKDAQDGLEDGFNTPGWMVNATLANNSLTKNLGAGITWRWQSSFYWQSFLVNGRVPAFGVLDAHASWRFNKMPVKLKAGGSNILNQYNNSFLGGPSVGGFYYISFEIAMLNRSQKK
jgi:iron complex outermembrane receptor protein